MTEKKSRDIAFTLVTVVLSVVLSLGAIEGLLRLKNSAQDVYDIEMWRYSKELKRHSDNPVLGHEHVESTAATLQNTEIRINERGLRGGPVPPVKEGQRRILFLGSSITLGWGVDEPKILTSRLHDYFQRDGQDTVVLNGGIGNYNTVRYVEQFMTKLADLKPTDVVVQYFVNDAETLETGGGNLLLRHSQLAVTLWRVVNQYFRPTGEDALVDHYRAVYRPDAPGFVAMLAALKKLGAYAKDNGIRLYLVMTPDIHNLRDYPFEFIHQTLRETAAKFGYRYLDLLPAMVSVDAKSIWALPGDPHPNARGHEIMAKAIYPLLQEPR